MQFFFRWSYATLIFSAVLLFCAAMPGSLAAQNSAGGSITGTVTDPGGRALQKVNVIARNQATHDEQDATSGDQGGFRRRRGSRDRTLCSA